MCRLPFFIATALIFAATLMAQEKPPGETPGAPPEKKEEKKETEKEQPPKESKGSVTIAGAKVSYVAKTGTLPVLKEDGSPRASIFFVYYVATDGEGKPIAEKGLRPITFCFNGGPGSAAVWLHFGGLGPKRIELSPDGLQPAGRGPIVENPNSILDVTDLVFVDPVGTGVSRPAKGEKAEQFWGVEEDVESIGEFIRLFATREQRWASPKYLCGESYGVLRASGLSDYLQDRHGMYLDGLIFLSGLLNFQTLGAATANDLPYILFLPTFTATAHYHKKLAADLQADLEKAMVASREFAQGEYTVALMKGRTIPAEQSRAIADKLARFTGLDAKFIADAHLRIDPALFRERLLREEGRIVGRFDARVTSEDANRINPHPEFDPSFTNVIGPFSAAANAYVRGELGYESDHPYRVLSQLNWNYRAFANRYVSMESALADAMKSNPQLRVLVLCSRRDLAVPGRFDAFQRGTSAHSRDAPDEHRLRALRERSYDVPLQTGCGKTAARFAPVFYGQAIGAVRAASGKVGRARACPERSRTGARLVAADFQSASERGFQPRGDQGPWLLLTTAAGCRRHWQTGSLPLRSLQSKRVHSLLSGGLGEAALPRTLCGMILPLFPTLRQRRHLRG